MSQGSKLNFSELMEVIDKCEGPVNLITEEGDIINLKSKLSQIIGLARLISNGTIIAKSIKAIRSEDEVRITRYLLYREV